MDENLVSARDVVEIVRRRGRGGVLVAGVLLLVSVLVTFGLPAIYRSRAVLLIEQQDVPEDFVRSLVTSYADQRIQIISQRVLTNANLVGIIDKYDLYVEERESEPLESIVVEMREDISVAPISADVVDQRSGRPTKATIAVELAYDSRSSAMAQRVTNDLVSLFLQENLHQRTEATEQTLSFLTAERERLRQSVGELESKLAAFKEANAGKLPELAQLNLQLLNANEQELAQIDNQMRSLEQQRVYLESELSQQSPTSALYTETGERMLSAADRIELREAEYVSLRARYGENHPDVRRMRKEIELLRGSSPTLLAAEQEGARELENLRAERAVLRQRYSSEHPDVRSIERKIAAVEAAWSERAGAARAGPGESPDNPVYVQLKARLDATSADLAALQAQRKVLRAKLLEFEQHITAAPQVEREYRSLTRDYEVAITEYQNVLAKKQQAEIAQSLESGQKGERFTLIEPPVVPEAPERPNRPVIGLLGVMLSVLGSIGFGAITEALDDRVFGRRGVMRVTGVQPLAVIPLLESAGARARRGRRRLLWLGGVVATVVCVAIVLHVMVRPLDVLFFRALRVLGW